ncbi:hypothetical protein L484_008677 [Morus notabilis]|uniref:Uncharacterized protein n=1 Tax=Morus notabilis TaxID=981085 RepID=W9QX71_9ROSA|nr:hypothetical protein L484_008677 [Morus notabilis]
MEQDALVGLRYCLGKIEITQKREKENPDAMEKIMTNYLSILIHWSFNMVTVYHPVALHRQDNIGKI